MNRKMYLATFLLLIGMGILPVMPGCGGGDGGCEDLDADAYFAQAGCGTAQDCDDTNPNVHPLAQEGPYLDPTCEDAADNDCDGATDGEDPGCSGCVDEDGDGYGTPANVSCKFPLLDCDDTNPEIHPGKEEIPGNGIDEDCYPLTPPWPTPASTVKPGHSRPLDVVNLLFIAFIPLGLILVLKRLRKNR